MPKPLKDFQRKVARGHIKPDKPPLPQYLNSLTLEQLDSLASLAEEHEEAAQKASFTQGVKELSEFAQLTMAIVEIELEKDDFSKEEIEDFCDTFHAIVSLKVAVQTGIAETRGFPTSISNPEQVMVRRAVNCTLSGEEINEIAISASLLSLGDE